MSRHCGRHSAEEFSALFDAHYADVLAYAIRRCPTPQDAEDVTAETFSVAWRRFKDIPGDGHDRLWLLGVARRVHANHRRGGRRRSSLLSRLLVRGVSGGSGDPAEHVVADDLVRRAFQQLAEADREILKLWVWDDLTAPQIGSMLGLSTAAVWKRLQRARERAALIIAAPAEPAEGEAAPPPDQTVRRGTALEENVR